MEQILVGIDGKNGAWEALARACVLARRIDARVHVLLVLPAGRVPEAATMAHAVDLQHNLQLRIESAKAQGTAVELYISAGRFEEEIVRFVNHYRITLLVWEVGEGECRSDEKEGAVLQAIRHRIGCKVELVAPKKQTHQPKERIA